METPEIIKGLIWLIVIVGGAVLIFLALREVSCWYLKINEGLEVLRGIRQELTAARTGRSIADVEAAELESHGRRTALGSAPGGQLLSETQVELPCSAVVAAIRVVPRDVPSETGAPMAELREGHSVTVYEIREGWGRISREGVQPRWARLDVLRKAERGP